MTLFRLDASIRTDGSHSRQLADRVQREWERCHPDEPVTHREVGIDPIPAGAWAAAVEAGATPEGERSPAQNEAVALAATLVDELAAADAMILAVPLYNFGVSQHFKAWVDLVVTDARMAAGATPAVSGTQAVLATARGGYYGAGTPREGWDHAMPWLRRMLADVWKLDLLVVEADFTAVGVDPALDQFAAQAYDLRTRANKRATRHGRVLAGHVAAKPATA